VRSQIHSGSPGSRLTAIGVFKLVCRPLRPGIGLFVQPIGQIHQTAISQCAAVRWNARRAEAFCPLAKLLSTCDIISEMLPTSYQAMTEQLQQNYGLTIFVC
jgi:hypothetical protein